MRIKKNNTSQLKEAQKTIFKGTITPCYTIKWMKREKAFPLEDEFVKNLPKEIDSPDSLDSILVSIVEIAICVVGIVASIVVVAVVVVWIVHISTRSMH